MSTLQPYFTASAELQMGSGGTLVLDAQPSAALVAELAPFFKGDPGAPGAPGAPGLNGSGYQFAQPTAATTWTIPHNLGLRPSVAVFGLGGVQILCTPQHLSDDVLQINFSTPTAGTARLN